MVEGDKSGGRRSLKQATTSGTLSQHWAHCISFDSYIKPQLLQHEEEKWKVVYLLNPTSNHNDDRTARSNCLLYIFWILHQTTTPWLVSQLWWRCISFESYIKPQLRNSTPERTSCCISFESYIKPQLAFATRSILFVVYLLNPTSNHNWGCWRKQAYGVVYLLNPTSNHDLSLRLPLIS